MRPIASPGISSPRLVALLLGVGVLVACAGDDPSPPPTEPVAGATSSFERARRALRDGAYAEAVGLLRDAAERGEPSAGFALGVLHAMGRGVARDAVQALRWYRDAAERGDGTMQYQLGERLAEGVAPRSDLSAEAVWLERLAGLGEPTSPLRAGSDYYFGESGLAADPTEAVRWYLRAAEQGHTMARYRLAQAYARGRGVEADRVQAHMWFDLCADLDLGDAAAWRDRLAELLSAEQLAESARLGEAWRARTPQPRPAAPRPPVATGRAGH